MKNFKKTNLLIALFLILFIATYIMSINILLETILFILLIIVFIIRILNANSKSLLFRGIIVTLFMFIIGCTSMYLVDTALVINENDPIFAKKLSDNGMYVLYGGIGYEMEMEYSYIDQEGNKLDEKNRYSLEIYLFNQLRHGYIE